MKLTYKIIGKLVEKAILPIIESLDNPPENSLSAFKERKETSLKMENFDKENAMKLYNITTQSMERF